MRIAGLQKLTLLDFPGHTACTVFTAGCNLRCPFCHNSELVLPERTPPRLEEEEFFSFLSKRQGILEGVCVTGGEPLLQANIAPFLQRIKALGFAVKLDTNGCFPQKLRRLVEEGLVDYVAMDVKNSRERYGETVGIPDFDTEGVEESVAFLLSGAVDYEFRTTVTAQHHDEESLRSLAQWISGARRYALQSFRDSGDVLTGGLTPYPPSRMREFHALVTPFVGEALLRGTDEN